MNFTSRLITLCVVLSCAALTASAASYSAPEAGKVQFIPEGDMIDVTGATSYTHDNRYTLWYNKPATTWMTSCLPIGDGQFGATIMGQVVDDEVQFNDKTLWTGKIGSLVDHNSYGKYLNFGSLNIHTDKAGDATDYVRYLDINNAVAGVKFNMGGVDYQRTYIASNPDSVVVIRYTAGRDGMINATLTMSGANGSITNYTVLNGQGRITFAGNIARTNNNGAAQPEAYMAEARVVIDGGALTCKGQNIKVTGANTMTVYLHGLTNFDANAPEYVSNAALVEPRLLNIINKAVAKDYNALLEGHKSDYKQLFDRCQLTLAQPVTTTTDSLITRYAADQETNRFLEELYFNYGRYLLISSSRGVALPANLQGIWNNNSKDPAWNSDIHANINVQMNYWPAEPTNLSELHMPMLDWIYCEAVQKSQWKANAKAIDGVDAGWTLTTENNIYGSGSNWKSNYTIANAWLASHLWQHYLYTQDRAFLRDKAMPVMKSCADYWLAKLKKNPSDGTYECLNEWSPEHGPDSENATAHSQQLVWDLFSSTLKAISALGLNDAKVDCAYIKKLKNHFDSLDNGCHTEVINGTTYLREWKTSSQAAYDWTTHRHISHLMGLYPLSQIGKEMNASIYEAAKNSLYARGMGGTGWSLGHKLNLMARVDDGEKCHQLIKNALRMTSTTTVQMSGHGGVYENLWDSHSPYQIDGNFGYTSGIAEMLLQSRFGKLEILPALPTKHWTSGSVTGLRAVGNFTVDITWQDTVATQLTVTSGSGLPCTVKYKNARLFKVTTANGTVVSPTVNGNDEITFSTVAGTKYLLDMDMAGDETGTLMNAADFQVVKVSDEEDE